MFRTSSVTRHLRVTPRNFQQRKASTIALKDLETRWSTMSASEQNTVAKQLEEAQKGDWKVLSSEDKKAAYYIAFGPHGPREPITHPGHGGKVFAGVGALLATSGVLFWTIRANGEETPHTLSKEWEQATNEYLRSQNSNPITGISSEGYKGKGYVR
ncbi:cytochrome c oxidase subunit IV [Zychaea mexicana]|uniref:cytochrome c oxidase subunit IV n=1 Tax=Zychaea mexicana TaxID=64656 RepID=UPI0022FEC7F5|nr:cytochrome c oxidase subunit IV [Zychaea mexicana]KAI9488246.1 cytochrome c oxidase subunit IV [Zychaea mexicana]